MREGLTIEDVDRQLKINEQKITLKRELAQALLKNQKRISVEDYESIVNLIDETSSIKNLSIIINSLNHSYCFGSDISADTIQKKIVKEAEMEKMLNV